MLLVIKRDGLGAVVNAYPIPDDDSRAALLAAQADTDVFFMRDGPRNTIILVPQRVRAGTVTTRVVVTGGELEIDPTR